MLAGLPYVVWPIGSFFILASRKKEDPFLCYHAVQALLSGAVMTAFVLAVFLFLFLGFRVMPGTASFGSPPEVGQTKPTDSATPGELSLGSETGPALGRQGGGLPADSLPTRRAGVYTRAMVGLGTLVVGGGVTIGVFLTALFLGWRATEGEMLRLPFLGDVAEEKMLDQTGMTRRQFEQMCEDAIKAEGLDEEIPFPKLRAGTRSRTTPDRVSLTQPPAERAIDRMEAARKARAAQQDREAPPSPRQAQRSQGAAAAQRPPASPQQRPGAPAGRPPQRRPQMPAPQEPAQPVVKEIDLISHYKDKKVGAGQQGGNSNEVLRQWLSSVDNES